MTTNPEDPTAPTDPPAPLPGEGDPERPDESPEIPLERPPLPRS